MRIAAFSLPGADEIRLGVLTADRRLVDLAETAGEGRASFGGMLAFLNGGRRAVDLARRRAETGGAARMLHEVRLRAPIANPGKILAVGLNYEEHRAEAGTAAPRPPYPEGFVKLPSSIVGPDDPIVAWPDVRQLDYEAELAVVIGAVAHNVTADEALDYVAGYTIANDISARDWQMSERSRGRSPLMGKNFPTFCPLGPWLVLTDEVPDPQALRVSLRVNGRTRQSAATAEMTFAVREIVAHWSRLRLEPGDIILTGTPAGVAMGHKPDPAPFWLRPGDVVEAEIDGIGVLRNPVTAAPGAAV